MRSSPQVTTSTVGISMYRLSLLVASYGRWQVPFPLQAQTSTAPASKLSIGKDLSFESLATSYHSEGLRKIRQRKCSRQHGTGIDHSATDDIERSLKREENRHRTNDGNLIVINAERRKRDTSFA